MSLLLKVSNSGYYKWLKNPIGILERRNSEDGNVPQFNGNISNQVWARDTLHHNTLYTYSYDKLNRL